MFFFSKRYTPKLTDISLGQPTWELYQQDDSSVAWYTSFRQDQYRDAVRIQLLSPCQWSFEPRDTQTAYAYWKHQSELMDGALIEMESLEIQGIPALRGLFKYRAPIPNSLAMYYVGIIWIPFEKCTYQINYEAIETGATGIREATVVAILPDNQLPDTQPEPEMLDSIEALFDKLRRSNIVRLPSDEQQYDEMFPEHPLSRVRTLLNAFPTQAVLSKKLTKQAVYRVAMK